MTTDPEHEYPVQARPADGRTSTAESLDGDSATRRTGDTQAVGVSPVFQSDGALSASEDWMKQYNTSEIRDSGLDAEPDEEVFHVCWRPFEPIEITVLARRGEDWKPRLRSVIRAELMYMAGMFTATSSIEDDDVTFQTIDPAGDGL